MSLIIHAPNVHLGGGKALLLPLLTAARNQVAVKALLDERLALPDGLVNGITNIRVKRSIFGRLAGEWRLRALAGEGDIVLCFGNLPPLFKLKAKVIVFLQNRYLVDKVSLRDLPLVARIRILAERLWLGQRVKHAHKVLVQTPSMQHQAQAFLGHPAEVIPFFDSACDYSERPTRQSIAETTVYDFVYVASGEPHKNHVRLIKAWKILAAEGLFPSLCLTVPEQQYSEVVDYIRRAKTEYGLQIENVSVSSMPEIEALYQKSGAVVYPSSLESFGLPLIEAREAGLPIIAAELDYVRDVVHPSETFDPLSSVSIARAVKRYLGVPERPLPVMTAERFLKELLINKW